MWRYHNFCHLMIAYMVSSVIRTWNGWYGSFWVLCNRVCAEITDFVPSADLRKWRNIPFGEKRNMSTKRQNSCCFEMVVARKQTKNWMPAAQLNGILLCFCCSLSYGFEWECSTHAIRPLCNTECVRRPFRWQLHALIMVFHNTFISRQLIISYVRTTENEQKWSQTNMNKFVVSMQRCTMSEKKGNQTTAKSTITQCQSR